MADVAVRVDTISKRYDHVVAVDDLSLNVQRGEFLSFLGPSGCGKTTTLRMIAGFVEPDAGRITIMGEDMTDRPPHKRNLGMVFQSYALFPHLTVFDNVAFGLRMRKVGGAELRRRVGQALDLVRLGEMGRRFPRQLSGGQQQRVALARAIVIEPYVLLLDEPLSNLDAKLRKTMQTELRDLQQRLGITTIYVTHDQEEAMIVSDRIVVMDRGRIMQIGAPADVYRHPANEFVAGFVGQVNLLRGRLERADGAWLFRGDGGLTVRLPERPDPTWAVADAASVDLAIRPEMVELRQPEEQTGLAGEVVRVVYTGASTTYEVRVGAGPTLLVQDQNRPHSHPWRLGDRVRVVLAPETLYPVPAAEDREVEIARRGGERRPERGVETPR